MNGLASIEERWEYILQLDSELLQGGAILSEWCAFLVQDADRAFVAGANLAAILASQAAIEAHLRFEYATDTRSFHDAIESSPLPQETRDELHKLRKFRNRWVHVSDPDEDTDLLSRQEEYELHAELFARSAMRLLRTVIYREQCV